MSDLVTLTHRMRETEARVLEIEKFVAATVVHQKNAEAFMKSTNGHVAWLVKLVAAALVMAVLAFVFQGGLALPL